MIRKLVLFTIMIVLLLCPKVEASQQSVSTVKDPAVKAKSIEKSVPAVKSPVAQVTTVKVPVTKVPAVKIPAVKGKTINHSVSTVKESIVKHSMELGIDPALALSIAKSESGFRHEARSSHGAVGVFQLMPSTAKRLGVNPYYLSDNIKGGLMYYKKMYSIFGSTELALAAYNAGPGAVKKYNRVPPIGETKKFVSNIMTEYNRQKINPDPAIAKMKNVNSPVKIINTKIIGTSKIDTVKVKPTAPIPTQGIV